MINSSGIYQIMNIVNSKIYIGSAVNLYMRKMGHLSYFRKGNGINKKFQNAYNKYGESNFVFSVLEYCEPNELIEKEQYYFDTILMAKASNNYFEMNSYNICRVAGSKLGVPTSMETKIKLSKAKKGRVVPQDVRDRTSETLKGRKHSPERILNMVKNKIKFYHTEESKIKIALNSPNRREIVQIDKKTDNIIKEWSSITKAQTELNIQHVSFACRGKRKTAGGYKWAYK